MINPYAFSLGELTPRRQKLSWFTQSGQVFMPITNHSDRAAVFRIEGGDEKGGCHFEFGTPGEADRRARQTELRLGPGQSAWVSARITPRARRLVGLTKQPYFCAITTTMLGEPPLHKTLAAELLCAPLIGPGLLALLTACLVLLAGLLLLPILQRLPCGQHGRASCDGQRVTGQAVQQPARPGLGRRASSPAAPPLARPPGWVVSAAKPASPGQMSYQDMFQEIAPLYDLDWRLLAQQAYRESRLDYLALGQANELGLMQIMPSTWNEWAPKAGVSDPWDAYSNVLVAAAYLAFLRDYFAEMGYPEDYWMLVAYNWGPDHLRQLFADGGGWDQVPPATRRYALEVLQAAETGRLSPAVVEGILHSVPVAASPEIQTQEIATTR